MSHQLPVASPPPAPGERERHGLARSFDIQGLRLATDGKRLVIDGDVPCYRTKQQAGLAAGHLFGFLHVVNRLRVVPQSHRRDADLAQAVRLVLATLEEESIGLSVCDGVVTLSGCVSSPARRCEAEALVWAVGGVADVQNCLRSKQALVEDRGAQEHTGLSAAGR